MREHERAGDIPTNGRFVFYELEQRGVIPKKYGINPKSGQSYARLPLQDVSVALMKLREHGLIPWEWLVDESRKLNDWQFPKTAAEYVLRSLRNARISVWGDHEAPLILTESRATAGVLDELAYEYTVPIGATGGQCGGHIVNKIVPLLRGKRPVRYIGDHELRGPAEHRSQYTTLYRDARRSCLCSWRLDQDRTDGHAGESQIAIARPCHHQTRSSLQDGQGVRSGRV
jgi:hypothetical protein